MKPKIRHTIALVCLVWGFILLIFGIGMGIMGEWEGLSWILLPIGIFIIVYAILILKPH